MWEYKSIYFGASTMLLVDEKLNEYGKDGWEIFLMHSTVDTYGTTFYTARFKKFTK